MEVEEIQAQPCKFPRIGNGGRGSGVAHNPDEEEDGRELKRAGGPEAGGGNRLNGWHHSRIIRVSRASGGKDRHSKVWTSKGLRDRRVRLSVTTAIQFYDLQDRLGYDQPSKAVEWLIKAAADAIAELPSLNNSSFPETPKQLSDEKRASSEHRFDSVELDADGDPNYRHQHVHNQSQSQSQNQNQNQHLSMSKSACSSTSETSKGSGLSLSRSEIRVNRVKARERARERAAKEKEKENNNNDESSRIAHAISQNASFTELLTGGIGSNNSPTGHQQNPAGGNSGEPILFHKAAPMDYFGSGLLGLSSSATRNHHHSGFSGHIHSGNSLPQTMFSISSDHNNHPPEMQHFSFVPDYIPVSAAANGGDYNLNFSMSSSGSLAGFNRGTLQSNSSPSPSLLPHLQRFSPIDGSSNGPFFIGGAAAAAAAPTMENHSHHHHHHHQFPAGLQLYGDGSRHSDHKGKAKN